MAQETITHLTDLPVITLDGGAATGKSSTASGVSERLHFLHVDTGSHYRALTLLLLERGVAPEEGEALDQALADISLSASVHKTHAKLLAHGEEISKESLRSPEVNNAVSAFAALPAVRQRLLHYQRWHLDLAQENGFHGLIVEGRDIGSVVFPDAPFRFFLEADETTRIQRRSEEGQQDSVAARDRADSGRKTAPLLCPEGAIRINTGKFSLEEVISQICSIAVDESATPTQT